MGGIGAPSPGMLFVEKPALYVDSRMVASFPPKNLPFTDRTTDSGGRYRPNSGSEEKSCLALDGPVFFYGFMISQVRPHNRSIRGYLKTHGGGGVCGGEPLAAETNF